MNKLERHMLSDDEINELIAKITSIPKQENNNCLSTYGSINVDDLIDAIKELRRVPTYDELLKRNVDLQEQIKDYEQERRNLFDAIEMLQEKLRQNQGIINKINKKCSKENGRTDFDVFIQLNEQLKTIEEFARKIDYSLHPIITAAYKSDIRNSIEDLCRTLRYDVVYKDSIKEILNKKGD